MPKPDMISNHYSAKKKVAKSKKPSECKPALIAPTFFLPQTKTFNSNFSEKNNFNGERLNSNCQFKSGGKFDMFANPLFPQMNLPSLNFPQSKYQSKISLQEDEPNYIKLESHSLMFTPFMNEQEDILNDKNKKEYNGNRQNNENTTNYFFNFLNGNYKLKENLWTPQKNANLNLNMNLENSMNKSNMNVNSGTKFFTNHNYGYKCSCSKTQCNRKYCECFNSGNYCIDCNCKNCNNKPPVNIYTNKHPTDGTLKNKKEKIICTCTKSGCNKNYCECFKSGQKCTSLCRCIICQNNDEIINKRSNNYYECCPVNSIYIIKNDLTIEDIEQSIEKRKNSTAFSTPIRSQSYMAISKKRKREERKNNEDSYKKKKDLEKYEEEIDLFSESLFDKNGKVILKHIDLLNK